MEFLNPAALYAFALLPLLLLPYLIRRRPRRLFFSSLLLLREFAARASARPWGRLYLPPIFFLQLLLLSLLFLALGEPSLSFRPVNVALVLDNSASMQAIEGEKSRFQLAQDEAAKILNTLPAYAHADLYVIAPHLTRVTEESLTPGAALARLKSLRPLDLGEPAIDYGAEFERLVRERKYVRLHFLTDHPAEGQSNSVLLVTLGRPKANLAVTEFQVARRSLASPQLEARVTIRNFSATEQKSKLALKGNGKPLVSRSISVAPAQSVEATFENFPFHSYYEA